MVIITEFYKRLRALCEERGMTVNEMVKILDLSSGSPTAWKKGAVPRNATLSKISDYFGVSVGYLLGKDNQKEKPLVNDDHELTDYLEMLKTRPECRMLFQLTKNATKEDVEAAVRIIEALRNK